MFIILFLLFQIGLSFSSYDDQSFDWSPFPYQTFILSPSARNPDHVWKFQDSIYIFAGYNGTRNFLIFNTI
jgi:hypothetical protein